VRTRDFDCTLTNSAPASINLQMIIARQPCLAPAYQRTNSRGSSRPALPRPADVFRPCGRCASLHAKVSR
jgi:hypothetical protein